MPARAAPAPTRERDYDFSNVGKVGRRTGVMLAPRGLDEYGLEEMTGMFSSPRKPSPATNKKSIMESVEEDEVNSEPTPRAGKPATPRKSTSLRRSTRGTSHPLPRSASPRKSGITGTARRTGTRDVLAQEQLQQELEDAQQQEIEARLSATPLQVTNSRAASAKAQTARKFVPDRTPLRNRVLNKQSKSAFVGRVSDAQSLKQDELETEMQPEETPSHTQTVIDAPEENVEDDMNFMGEVDDEEHASIPESDHEEPGLPPLRSERDDEEEDTTFEPEKRPTGRRAQQNKANSRRKRKSDAMDDAEMIAISSPAAKRAKRKSDEGAVAKPRTTRRKSPRPESEVEEEEAEEEPAQAPAPSQKPRGRKPLAKKDTNTKLSTSQQKQVDEAVEKIRKRPGQQGKSLYILRRETPADDSVTHTRSGRVSIKPLAYWRNEGVVYSESPNASSRGIQDGARFPVNSIKEIIRNEEIVDPPRRNKKAKGKKGKGKARQEEDDSDLDLDGGSDEVDPDADDWELDTGTLKVPVSVWDAEQQAPIEEEEEVEIAHAAAAIQTKEVKGSTFRYAKLLSTRFFGTGVVDLPPGGIKKPKNSRKMHMSFFVAQGRVTVVVGPLSGQETRFSIGKGGFWQVPRGNQYSIENEFGKSARIFFSQACEPAPQDLLEE